jgi:hypothetical protein
MSKKKYPCPCCTYKTFDEKPNGTFYVCLVCFWEDDLVQLNDPDSEGGVNGISLRQAQNNFKQFGAMEKRFEKQTRKPYENEL